MQPQKKGKFLNFLINLLDKPISPSNTAPNLPHPDSETNNNNNSSIGNKRALLIGINYLEDINNRLNGCINDVNNIKQILINKFNYQAGLITVLTDDGKSNGIPTKNSIIANINNIVTLTKPGDTIYLHYSGHGSQLIAKNNNESNNVDTPGMDDCICPCDFNKYSGAEGFITDNILREILVNKIPKGAKLRAVFDACHSASMLDLEYMWKGGEVYIKEHPNELQSSDIVLISGCRDNQTSADTYNTQQRQAQGALTMMLIKALNSEDIIKRNWRNLILRLRELLNQERYDQFPMLSVGDKLIGAKIIDL